MTWNQNDGEVQQDRDNIRTRLAYCRAKGLSRDHAWDFVRPTNYKQQALAEMARRLVAEEDAGLMRSSMLKLDDILDIIQDLGDKCPDSLKPHQRQAD